MLAVSFGSFGHGLDMAEGRRMSDVASRKVLGRTWRRVVLRLGSCHFMSACQAAGDQCGSRLVVRDSEAG